MDVNGLCVSVRHEASYGHMSGSFGFYFGEAVNPIPCFRYSLSLSLGLSWDI